MGRLTLAEQRRVFGFGLVAATAAAVLWAFSPGLPVWWGPTAWAADKAAGRELFEKEWAANDAAAHGDGLGPVFNARSCAECHFQGGVGGGGDAAHNVTTFEVLARPGDPTFRSGTVHAFSTSASHAETLAKVHKAYPPVQRPPVTVPGVCGGPSRTVTPPPFDPVRTDELNTTALFGAGWLDLIADRAVLRQDLSRSIAGAYRELTDLDFSGNVGGRPRWVGGGRVGKFGWKAQFATLEEFVAAACANELGLGTPGAPQAAPVGSAAPADVTPDLDRRQVKAMAAFVRTLPRPVEVPPADPAGREAAARGKELFATVGCAACHVPDLGGVSGVYTDLLLHVVDDPNPQGGFGDDYGPQPLPEFPRPADLPNAEEWRTPPLWGVADSAPYFHDGRAATLEQAIQRHRGEARPVTEAYQKLSPADKAAVVAFLKTLKAPPDARPYAPPVAVAQVTAKR